MNKNLVVKLIVSVALVVFVFLAWRAYRTDPLISYISLIASAIQIVLFCVWFLEDRTVLNRVDTTLKDVKEYVTEKDKKNMYREVILRKILNKGLVNQAEITNLLTDLQNKDVVLLSLSECRLPKGLSVESTGSYPLRHILNELGFIPVFFSFTPNTYITFKNDLPRSLRDIAQLESFISKELSVAWDSVKRYAQTHYPAKYEKWKSGSGFKASYVLSKSFENDFKIEYKQRPTFSEQLITKLLKETSSDKLQKAIPNKLQVKEILSKISIEIVLDTVENPVKEAITKNERTIWSNLRITSFLDFRNADLNELISELKKYISEEKAINCANIMIEECKKAYAEIDSMGILIS